MNLSKAFRAATLGLITSTVLYCNGALAGPVFLTGHDPDFHAQGSVGAQNLLRAGLNFTTGGTYDDGPSTKFLWVESRGSVPGGHLIGENGLVAIGLALGTNYDRANAAELPAVNLSNYTAIVIASSFGGLLGDAEIQALVARSADIASFINSGRGLFAMSECGVGFPNCQSDLVTSTTPLFGFLPVTVSSVATVSPYSVTAFGASLGLTNADVNDPTHNSFGVIGGLSIVDTDAGGVATTLAGNVRVNDGGFTPTPLPGSLALLGIGLAGLGFARRGTR